jgi:hypothetical protein
MPGAARHGSHVGAQSAAAINYAFTSRTAGSCSRRKCCGRCARSGFGYRAI